MTDISRQSTIAPANITELVPTLQELNDAEVARLIPTLIFLGIISLAGIFGNGLVCHIYRTRYRLSNSQCFILCLSAIDLFSCLIVIPIEITTVINQYTFEHVWLCRLSRFFNTLSTLSSSFLLLFIAIDRYRKVCKPFGKQISARVAKFLCVLTVLLGLLFSWPAVIVYGRKTFAIPEYNLVGAECSTDDSLEGTMYPFINVAVYAVLFLSGLISMSVMYCLIGREVHKHIKRMPKVYHINIQSTNSAPTLSSTVADRGSKMEDETDANTLSRYKTAKLKNKENRKRFKRYKPKHKSTTCIELSLSEKSKEFINENFEMQNKAHQDTGEEGPEGKNDDKMKDKTNIVRNLNESKYKEDERNAQQISLTKIALNMKQDKQDTNETVDAMQETSFTFAKGDDVKNANGHSSISSEGGLNKERNSLGGIMLSITSQMSNVLSRMTSITSRQSEPNISTVGKTQYLKQARARKTAFLMFCISLAFILSYLPHLLLMLMRAVKDDFVDNMSDSGRAVYRFFLRSFFLQCMINPIIYAACASKFRNEVKEVFNGWCGRAESGEFCPKK